MANGEDDDGDRHCNRDQRCQGGAGHRASDSIPRNSDLHACACPVDQPGRQDPDREAHRHEHGGSEKGDRAESLDPAESIDGGRSGRLGGEEGALAPRSLLGPDHDERSQDEHDRKDHGWRAIEPAGVLGVDDPREHVESHETHRSEVRQRVERCEQCACPDRGTELGDHHRSE
ncbi:MAG: DUF6455 family protein, partial [Acidimicrobiia bacterium]